MRQWLVLGMTSLVVAVSRPALADANLGMKQCRALVGDLATAITRGDPKAIASTLRDDGFAFLPTAADEARGPAAIETAAKRWLASVGKVVVKVEHLECSSGSSWFQSSWCSAELVATGAATARWQVTAIAEPRHGDDGGVEIDSDKPKLSDYKLVALHLSEQVDDKLVLAAAAAGKLPIQPRLELGGRNAADDLNKPDRIAKWSRLVLDDGGAVLIGSAPGERALGQAAVAARLASWKSLKLATLDSIQGTGDNMGTEWVIAHAEATFTIAGKPAKVPYRVTMLVAYPPAAGGGDPKLLAAHFSVALH